MRYMSEGEGLETLQLFRRGPAYVIRAQLRPTDGRTLFTNKRRHGETEPVKWQAWRHHRISASHSPVQSDHTRPWIGDWTRRLWLGYVTAP
jgi:hypothetical protein